MSDIPDFVKKIKFEDAKIEQRRRILQRNAERMAQARAKNAAAAVPSPAPSPAPPPASQESTAGPAVSKPTASSPLPGARGGRGSAYFFERVSWGVWGTGGTEGRTRMIYIRLDNI